MSIVKLIEVSKSSNVVNGAGYTLKEIGYVVKVVAVMASILGFFLGGLLVKKLGVKITLIIGALLGIISAFIWQFIVKSITFNISGLTSRIVIDIKEMFSIFKQKFNLQRPQK